MILSIYDSRPYYLRILTEIDTQVKKQLIISLKLPCFTVMIHTANNNHRASWPGSRPVQFYLHRQLVTNTVNIVHTCHMCSIDCMYVYSEHTFCDQIHTLQVCCKCSCDKINQSVQHAAWHTTHIVNINLPHSDDVI